jgi:hypothetical protein
MRLSRRTGRRETAARDPIENNWHGAASRAAQSRPSDGCSSAPQAINPRDAIQPEPWSQLPGGSVALASRRCTSLVMRLHGPLKQPGLAAASGTDQQYGFSEAERASDTGAFFQPSPRAAALQPWSRMVNKFDPIENAGDRPQGPNWLTSTSSAHFQGDDVTSSSGRLSSGRWLIPPPSLNSSRSSFLTLRAKPSSSTAFEPLVCASGAWR